MLNGQRNFRISPTRAHEPFLYSVCDPAGVKLEKTGGTDSPPLIKYLTYPLPFLCAFPQMKKQMASLEPI